MSHFVIVFLDGEEVGVDAVGFSVAKVKASFMRVLAGFRSHKELTVDDGKSANATRAAR